MDTKKKISVLFIGAVLLYLLSFVVFETIQQHQHSLLYSSRFEVLNQSVNAAIRARQNSMNNICTDYTIWDEMIDFVKVYDSKWAIDNMEPLLITHKLNVVWVYNLEQEKIYAVDNCFGAETATLEIPQESLDMIRKQKEFQFYLDYYGRVLLVSGALVQHTTDMERKGPAYGYFLIAKCIDADFLNEIGALTGSTVKLVDLHNSDSIKTDPSQVKLTYPLQDYTGRVLHEFVFIRDYPYVNDFFLFSRISMLLFIGIGLFVILAIYFLFSRWVSKPLSKINYALVNNDIRGIDLLSQKPDEFGKLAKLLENFINQKKELENQIIEKNKTEKYLLESEEKFSKAFLYSPAAMMITDLDTTRIISVNESFLHLTGLNNQIVNRETIDSIGVFNDPVLFKSIAFTLEHQQKIDAHEIFIKAKSGNLRFGILKCDIVFLQGKSCLLSVILDITDRKQVELAMNIAKDKAEESDRLKYFLLMNMSHELRTPLTGIIGFAEVIKDDSNERLIKSLADKILLSSDRLLSTLNSIMLLAEIHSKNLSVQNQKCKLGPIISRVCERFAETAAMKGMEIHFEEEEVWSELDPEYLREIAERIIDNAFKFSEKGSVSVKVRKHLSILHNWAVFSVTDTGIGIESGKINEIFLEFRQLSEGAGRSFEGCGLGLSISKNLAALMHGEISVESKVGVGSTFIVKFPLMMTDGMM